MRVLVRCRDVSNTAKAQILSFTAHRLAADGLPVLPVTADIRSSAFGMLTAACTTYSLVVLWATITACYNDFATVQSGIEGFQLVNQFGCNQSFMATSALTPKFPDVEMRGKLCIIVIIIMIDWHDIILSQKIFLEKFEKTLDKHIKMCYNNLTEGG
jgi:hypothetical protein